MNADYKVIIYLSHHHISFEYWLKGGGDVLLPIKAEASRGKQWPVPLSIYIPNDGGLIIGEEAALAASQGIPNAFSNLFERMSNPNDFYEIYGEKKPICNLLLDAAEVVFRDFFSKVLLNSNGNLEQNRSTMPIVIVCEDDILSNERVLIQNLFRQSGFAKVSVVNYQPLIDQFVRGSISSTYSQNFALSVWNEGKNLYLTLFKVREEGKPIMHKLPELGVDPRLSILEDKIWADISFWNPYLSREDNSNAIKQAAKNFLNSQETIYQGSLATAEGLELVYNLDRNSISHFQNPTTQALVAGVRLFMTEKQIPIEDTLLILRGDAANDYFEETLGMFPKTLKSNNELRSKVMKAIINLPTPDVITPPPTPLTQQTQTETTPPTLDLSREWREVKAKASGTASIGKTQEAILQLETFLKKCKDNAATNLMPLVEELIEKIKKSSPPPPPPPPQIDLSREWREVKAKASGSASIGKTQEAIMELEKFLKKCKDNAATNLMPLVEELIKKIKKISPPPPPPPPIDLSREWREIKAKAIGMAKVGKTQEAVMELETFLKKCEKVGTKDLIPLIRKELEMCKVVTPPPPPPVKTDNLVREWKQVKAAANGKVRSQKNAEAKKMLTEFLTKCTKAGAKDIITEIRSEIAKIK